MNIESIGVFCGSNNGVNNNYTLVAEELGKYLANNNLTLIYGDANVGLMKICASSSLNSGGRVTGIIKHFWQRNTLPTPALLI